MDKTRLTLCILSAFVFWAVRLDAAMTAAPPAIAVLDWAKMHPAEFGCYLHTTFGIRDKNWNCDQKKPAATGDPCTDTKTYYAGPQFPKRLVKKIDSRLDEIQLAWEHGNLQALTLVFTAKVSEAEARAMSGLPQEGLPQNLMSIDLQQCGRDATCLVIQMFDHLGAGEAGCGGS